MKKPVVLVGASLGGSIAIDFAVAHPDAVRILTMRVDFWVEWLEIRQQSLL